MIKYLQNNFFPVCIGFISTEKEYKREMKRLGMGDEYSFLQTDHASATLHSGTDKFGRYIMVLCVNTLEAPKRTPIEVSSLMAHEAVHVWQKVKAYIGEGETIETESYFVQYITQFFLECIEDDTKFKLQWKKG